MFGLGIPEIICIILIAVIVLGPEHTPRAAQMIGKWSAKLRSAATSFEQAIAQDEDLREIQSNLSEVKAEIDKAKSELLSVRDEVTQIPNDVSKAYQEAKDELQHIEGVVGRQPSKEADEPPTPPTSNDKVKVINMKVSPFLSQPLHWFKDPQKQTAKPQNAYTLEAPKPLFDTMAAKVQQDQYSLDLPKESTHIQTHTLPLPTKDCAFCRIRKLSLPQAGLSHTMRIVPLKRHE